MKQTQTNRRRTTAQVKATEPKTIDDYLAALTDDKRAALEKLRKTIRAAAPKAEECISYQLPAFRLNGMLVAFGATANHCAFYPMSSSAVEAHKEELKGFEKQVARAIRPLRSATRRPELRRATLGFGADQETASLSNPSSMVVVF